MSETPNECDADRRADELTELAAHKSDPGVRLFFLEWAKAFRKLAALGALAADQAEEDDKPH